MVENNCEVEKVLKVLVDKVDDLKKIILEKVHNEFKIYNSTETCKKLGVSQKTLCQYRTNGLIGFCQINGVGKITHSLEDIQLFCESHHKKPIGIYISLN